LESHLRFALDLFRFGSENYDTRVTPHAYAGTLADVGRMLPPNRLPQVRGLVAPSLAGQFRGSSARHYHHLGILQQNMGPARH